MKHSLEKHSFEVEFEFGTKEREEETRSLEAAALGAWNKNEHDDGRRVAVETSIFLHDSLHNSLSLSLEVFRIFFPTQHRQNQDENDDEFRSPDSVVSSCTQI